MAYRFEWANDSGGNKYKFTTPVATQTSPMQPTQKSPTNNIIGNISFERASAKSSTSFESNSKGQYNQSSNHQSIPGDNDEVNAQTGTKPRNKRNSSSFSSSLRRLLTITFTRNPQSSSSTVSSKSSNIRKASVCNRDTNNNDLTIKPSTSDRENSTTHNATSSKQNDKVKRNKKRRYFSPTTDSNLAQNADLDKKSKASKVQRSSIVPQVSATGNLESNNILADGIDTSDNERLATSEIPGTSASCQDISQVNNLCEIDGKKYIECPLCVLPVAESSTPNLRSCRHRVCLECMQRYITTEINHSRLNITCPICSELIHPVIIKLILQNEEYYLKYESFMLRRVLAAESDARWCPAPDCGYVVLANGCASCPRLVCGREGCNTAFCYHCKQEWHPNQTCTAASIQRNKHQANTFNNINYIEESTQSPNRKSSKSSQRANSIKPEDIKECPVCSSRIIKMNDGSCNHMTCSICETEFCWLCMKEISDLHYFSPSGCTFWGKKPWSRKKKLLWQLGMLVGAPICIILIAGIAVPAIVIGIPVWAARKLHTRLESKSFSRSKKNAIITGGVLLSFIVSPIVSAIALAVGIPILLGYVYGVVPLSLCRSSSGCLSSADSLENLQQQIQAARARASMNAAEVTSIDTALSHKLGDPSIGETSLYMSNISLETNSIGHVTTVEREDRESASNAALAGSIISNVADDGNSTRALAGSILSKESGYTLVPAEVHASSQATFNNSSDQTNMSAKISSKTDRRIAGT